MVYDTEKPILYAIDMDGTLTNGEYYWEGVEPTPNQKVIDWVNRRYMKGHHIIIHTARLQEEYRVTEAWLIKHGVKFHGIRMGKMGTDIYLDDKSINPEVLG